MLGRAAWRSRFGRGPRNQVNRSSPVICARRRRPHGCAANCGAPSFEAPNLLVWRQTRKHQRKDAAYNALGADFGMSISGLVVEYIVAIDVTRVRFPADALRCFPCAQQLAGLASAPESLWCVLGSRAVGPIKTIFGRGFSWRALSQQGAAQKWSHAGLNRGPYGYWPYALTN